jgi:hypothetical protein
MKKSFGIALSKSQQNTPFWMREDIEMVLLLDRRARLLSTATAEEAAGIAKQICPDIWIGISAHNNSAWLTARGPTDNISSRRIARHGCYARRRVRVSQLDRRALRLHLPSIGR